MRRGICRCASARQLAGHIHKESARVRYESCFYGVSCDVLVTLDRAGGHVTSHPWNADGASAWPSVRPF